MPQSPRSLRPIVHLHRRRSSLAVLAGVLALATFVAGCSSSSSAGGGSATSTATGSAGGASTAAGSAGTSAAAGSGDAGTSAATAEVTKYLTLPTAILQTEKFTPKTGDLVYNISCNLAIVGCSQISDAVGKAATGFGDTFQKCDAGTTPSQAQSCFTNAVNAGAKVIVINGVPVVGAGSGYAQAKTAGIPTVGIFTGNPVTTPGQATQVALDAPTVEAKLLADYAISKSDGKANVLYLGDNQDGEGVLRGQSFHAEMAKCTGCKVKEILIDINTQVTTGPTQITATLQANPDIDWIIANNDGAAAAAVTVVGQLGRQSSVQVGGMDANPQNLQYVKQGKQAVDVTVGQGELGFAGVYAAAQVLAGVKVATSFPVNVWLIDKSNVAQVPASGVFFGPANYDKQFLALGGK